MTYTYNNIIFEYCEDGCILYKTTTILQELKKSKLFNELVRNYKLNRYNGLNRLNKLNSQYIDNSDLYEICKMCIDSDSRYLILCKIFMITVNYNIKHYMAYEDFNITTINKDVFEIIIKYVYEIELYEEEEYIIDKINFVDNSIIYNYVHSLLNLQDLIDIIKYLYRFKYTNGDYDILVKNTHNGEIIYKEYGYFQKNFSLDINYLKTLHTSCKVIIQNENYIIFIEHNIFPFIYYMSQITIKNCSYGGFIFITGLSSSVLIEVS